MTKKLGMLIMSIIACQLVIAGEPMQATLEQMGNSLTNQQTEKSPKNAQSNKQQVDESREIPILKEASAASKAPLPAKPTVAEDNPIGQPLNKVFPDPQMAFGASRSLGKAYNHILTQEDIDNAVNWGDGFKGLKVENLEGIQYFTSLKTLDFSDHHIETLDPIVTLRNLSSMKVDNNLISRLPEQMGALKNLTNLSMSGNRLDKIDPIVKVSHLSVLNLEKNLIKELPEQIGSLQYLTDLNVAQNQLKALPESIGSLYNIKSFNVSHNFIEALPQAPLSDWKWIETLALNNNGISDFRTLKSLEKNTQLTVVELSSQNIKKPVIDVQRNLLLSHQVYQPNGSLVTITSVSHNGHASGTAISWELNLYIKEISYEFSETVQVGNKKAVISGIVRQPLKRVLEYLVTYDIEGKVEHRQEIYGFWLEKIKDPVKAGHTFDGWYTMASGGKKWEFESDTMPLRDLTLYARFQPAATTYVVSFDTDGQIVTQNVVENTLVSEPKKPSKQGYVFDGWYTMASGGKKWNFAIDKMPASNLTLYARFQPAATTYVVSFDTDGQIVTQNVVENTLVSEPKKPSKQGYVFDGWYTMASGGKKWDFAIDKMPASNLTLHARFQDKNTIYVVSFDNDGVIEKQNVVIDTLLSEPKQPNKSGYVFDGWYTMTSGGKKWNFASDKMPLNNLTLYAKYQVANASHVVSFNNDGVIEKQNVVYNTLLQEPLTPKKTGYVFTGWYTEAAGGKKWNFAVDKMMNQDFTLYAQYEREGGQIIEKGTKSGQTGLPRTGAYTYELLFVGIVVFILSFVAFLRSRAVKQMN